MMDDLEGFINDKNKDLNVDLVVDKPPGAVEDDDPPIKRRPSEIRREKLSTSKDNPIFRACMISMENLKQRLLFDYDSDEAEQNLE
jgi:hypothetical protein